MAKILIGYYRSDELSAGTTLCFYESLFYELKRYGNDVMAINLAYYGVFNPNVTDNKAVEEYLVRKSIEFAPDLIIAFNHHILRSILNVLRDVPIVIYDGDELRFFADLDIIKKDIGRYKIFSIVKSWRQSYLDFGFRDDQVFYMPPGTAITPDKSVVQDKPISFLGQRRYFLSTKLNECIRQGKNLDLFYKLYLDFLETKDYNYVKLFQRDVESKCGIHMEDIDLWPLFDQSFLIFSSVLDLGLHLGGHEGAWCDIAPFIPQLAITHDRSRVFNLEENLQFYNSSVLSLCPMHPQAQGQGFSWRCFDIMGSNACLVSSTSSELRERTKGWMDIPMFDTPMECRVICESLLKDEKHRTELCQASQEFVDKNCRWEQRFVEMEQILGLCLINKDAEGSFQKLTEQPVWLEDSGSVPSPIPASPQTPVEAARILAENTKNIRRWERHMKIRSLADRIHKKSTSLELFQFLCWGELLMLLVCVVTQMGSFVFCLGRGLSFALCWVSGIGALAFFLALCVCFFFKFIYKGFFKAAYQITRKIVRKLHRS